MLKEDYKNILPEMNSWLLPRENGMLLSDYQIDVLARNGIDYLKYGTISEILYTINEILDKQENEELEDVAKKLDESNYYRNVNN